MGLKEHCWFDLDESVAVRHHALFEAVVLGLHGRQLLLEGLNEVAVGLLLVVSEYVYTYTAKRGLVESFLPVQEEHVEGAFLL